jgi:hypothetical protein
MTKLSACAMAIAVVLGTIAMLSNSKPAINSTSNVDVRLDSDGAYRDGLYLGKLAAASGQPQRLAVGRWSTDQDRATFTIGYRRGYGAISATLEP